MQYPPKEKASARAEGHWPNILEDAGVPSAFLNKKHGPCPFCGGTDRFIFKDRGKGLWVCSQCTSDKYEGGLGFLMRHMRYTDIKQAAAHVHRYFDGDGNERVVRPGPVSATEDRGPAFIQKRLRIMRRTIDQTRPVTRGDPVDLYLRGRIPGLVEIPSGIRFHPSLEYWGKDEDGNPELQGLHPAMVVAGYDAQDNLVQIHKTYLTPEGQKADVPNVKKTDTGIGCNSFTLRIMPVGDSRKLGVGEGIETCLASWVRYGVPVWPCFSANVLEAFVVPDSLIDQVDLVMIFGDNDERKKVVNGRLVGAGNNAATNLASSLRKQRKRSMIVMPAKVGTDMDDFHRELATTQ